MSITFEPEYGSVEAVTIEIDEITAGLALRERTGFRFIASDPRFRLLDGSRFRRLNQIEAAARRMVLAHSAAERRRAA
ncbi:hypothetical protein [Zavarzinia sp.]|uniref:hypothetical protein n=1 Tax=Zavarzinia sp. TaxID=2027920 RepID=UPI003BB7CFEF|nr:hypothetical protein [Zavarzinia sp.]